MEKRAPIVHELKTWPIYFTALKSGVKSFEIRTNDRDFQVGDKLVLREYEPSADRYTGRQVYRRVTYIAQGVFGLPDGVCVMGLANTVKPNI
jgi:hypothetical protein